MPDLIPYSESTGTNTLVLQPEGHEGVHDFTQEDFGLYAWFESRYVYSMHSLFHHYVTNCHFTVINQIEPFRLTFQVTPSGGVELISLINPGCFIQPASIFEDWQGGKGANNVHSKKSDVFTKF